MTDAIEFCNRGALMAGSERVGVVEEAGHRAADPGNGPVGIASAGRHRPPGDADHEKLFLRRRDLTIGSGSCILTVHVSHSRARTHRRPRVRAPLFSPLLLPSICRNLAGLAKDAETDRLRTVRIAQSGQRCRHPFADVEVVTLAAQPGKGFLHDTCQTLGVRRH